MREELTIMPRQSQAPPSPSLRELLAVFFRYQRLWMLAFTGVLAVVLAYGLLGNRYSAHMRILVRRGRTDAIFAATLPQPSLLSHGEVSEEDVNSEVELLRDDEILGTVVQSAGLGKSTWFSDLTGEDEATRLAWAVKRLRGKLEVEPLPRTTLIAVSYPASDPAEAKRVLRCLADAYLQRHARVRRPPGEFDFFQQQVTRSRLALEQLQGELLEFSRDEGVVSADLQRDATLQKLSEAEANYSQIQVSKAETEKRIHSLESQLRSLPERTITLLRSSDNPQLLQQMKGKLLELQLRRTELLTKYQPTYRLVQEVDEEIAETKASLANEESAPLRDQTTDQDANHEWAKSELVKAEVEKAGLEAREIATSHLLSNLRESASQLGERAVGQEALLQDVKAAEEQYLLYVRKLEEARIGDALDRQNFLNVSIVEQPTTPVLPVHSALGIGLIGLVSAGTVSTGVIFVADYLNPSFRTPDEVLAYLGAPVLASLPSKSGPAEL